MREYLDHLEELLQQSKPSKKYMVTAGIVLLLLLLFYYFYLIDAIDRLQSTKEETAKTQQAILKNSPKRYLAKIVAKKKRLLVNKEMLSKKKMELTMLTSKLYQNEILRNTQKNFNLFLEHFLKDSVRCNIDVKNLEIKDTNTDFIGKLKTIRTVQIEGTGRFLDILTLLRDAEEERMLLFINDLNIETNGSTPSLRLHIDFYGAKL